MDNPMAIGLKNIINTYVDNVEFELNERWRVLKIDLYNKVAFEVVGALLARQVVLSKYLALSPSIWNVHIAPLFLRSMADLYIVLSWMFKDIENNTKEFVLYGLGQEKLNTEHYKAYIGSRTPSQYDQMCLDLSEQWLNQQRLAYLTEVNIGNIDGKTTRTMSKIASCEEFYNIFYSNYSACTHSMWHHVGKYNLKECINPLHGLHKVPCIIEKQQSEEWVLQAAYILDETFILFDEKFDICVAHESSYKQLLNMFSELFSDDENLQS